MKRIIAIAFAVLLLCQVNVFAEGVESGAVALNTADSEIVVHTPDNIVSENGIVFGMPEHEFKEYMQSNNMILYGSYNNDLFVFNLSCTSTSFAGEVTDFFEMDDDAVLSFADDFVQNKDGIAVVNDIKYVISKSTKEADGVVFSTVQYITVRNGDFYVLTVNVPKGENIDDTSKSIDDLLERITISKETQKKSLGSVLTIALLCVLILVILAVIVIVSISIIKDLRKNN